MGEIPPHKLVVRLYLGDTRAYVRGWREVVGKVQTRGVVIEVDWRVNVKECKHVDDSRAFYCCRCVSHLELGLQAA